MLYHIKNEHWAVISEKGSQTKVTFQSARVRKCEARQSQAITPLLCSMIKIDPLQIRMVKDKEFEKLIWYLKHESVLPLRIAVPWSEKYFEEKRDGLKVQLNRPD